MRASEVIGGELQCPEGKRAARLFVTKWIASYQGLDGSGDREKPVDSFR